MTTYVALLRAVNLGSHNQVKMADLRDLCARVELAEARTLLQSGNVVFRAASRSTSALERTLETELETRLGVRTDFFVRTAREWSELVAANPFPAEAERDPGHLLALVLRDAPKPADVKALQAAISGPELVRAVGKAAYVVYPAGIGVSRLTNAVIEKKLGTRSTGRNWNTVLKLLALTAER
jgi:uncharacterized protein (DUF1697 family)